MGITAFATDYLGCTIPYIERGLRLLAVVRGRRQRVDNESLRRRYYREYWQRVARNMGGELKDVGHDGYLQMRYRGDVTFIRSYEVQIDDHMIYRIAGDKIFSQGLLRDAGFPVPRHLAYRLGSMATAIEFFRALGKPVVIKPVNGAGGLGVTTDVRDLNTLRRASFAGAVIGSQLLIEEQVTGDNYRFLYLDGELLDVVRRDQPTVLGDGHRNIRQLIALENERRLAGPPWVSMSSLTYDSDAKTHLRAQGLSSNFAPREGELLQVKRAVSQNGARDNHRITSNIHHSFQELGRRIQKTLGIKLLGVDVIAKDISVTLEECGGVINEVNTTPAFHHHDLVAEESDDCRAGQLALEFIFARGKNNATTASRDNGNG